jgi:hypothetical protein
MVLGEGLKIGIVRPDKADTFLQRQSIEGYIDRSKCFELAEHFALAGRLTF